MHCAAPVKKAALAMTMYLPDVCAPLTHIAQWVASMHLSSSKRRANRTRRVLITRQQRLAVTQAVEIRCENACGEMGRRLLSGAWKTSRSSIGSPQSALLTLTGEGARQRAGETSGMNGIHAQSGSLVNGVHAFEVQPPSSPSHQSSAVDHGKCKQVVFASAPSKAASADTSARKSIMVRSGVSQSQGRRSIQFMRLKGALSRQGRAMLEWKAAIWPVRSVVSPPGAWR